MKQESRNTAIVYGVTQKSQGGVMNKVLWVVQVVLALLFFGAGRTSGKLEPGVGP